MNSTVLIVGVCFNLEPSIFISKLVKLFARSGKTICGVVVSNNNSHSLISNVDGIQVLRGTNSHLDFSGYFEGFEHLSAANQDIDSEVIFFTNDTLFTKHAAPTIVARLLRLHALLSQLTIPAMAGKTDTYKTICTRNPWSNNNFYVTSFCFLLNGPALPLLQQLLPDANNNDVLVDFPLNYNAWGKRLNGVMREYIRAHLIYKNSPYIWKSSEILSPALLARKAHCVYFEHRLSGLIGLNGAILPINAGTRAFISIYFAELMSRLVINFHSLFVRK